MKTLLEKYRTHRYGKWYGNPKGFPFEEGRCGAEVNTPGGVSAAQCTRLAKYGPEKLFCKQHAEMLEEPS